MKKVILFILSTLIISFSWSQTSNLTKKQMYQDFDQLLKIIIEGNPQIEARKIVTGFDQIKTIKNLRTNIDTITSDEEFRKLLNRALFYVFDGHTREEVYYYPNMESLDGIDTTYMKKQQEIKSSIKSLANKMFPINAIYYDDDYFLLGNHNFIHKDKKDTLNIQLMRIISFNGQDFGKYVDKNCLLSNYDYIRRKYYTNWVHLPNSGRIKGEQFGKIIEFNIEDYPYRILGSIMSNNIFDVWFHIIPKAQFSFELKKEKKVDYIEEDSVLYIYLDRMIQDEFFCTRIKEIGKNKHIKKIIIDVKGNPGGSDYAWWDVLSAIVKDTLYYDIKLGYNDSKTMRKIFKHYPNKGYEKIEWLENKKIKLISDQIAIIPDINSLQFDGKIFILADRNTYSSGFSLVNCAEQADQLISIGEPSGQIRGMGVSPKLFQLKHSKFTFRLACVIDIYNANKAIDIYKDFPEIIVFPSFEEIIIHPRVAYNIKSREYLRMYDSMYKKALSY